MSLNQLIKFRKKFKNNALRSWKRGVEEPEAVLLIWKVLPYTGIVDQGLDADGF